MRLFGRTALAAFALSAITVGAAHAATDPAATINSFYAALRQTMERGPQLGAQGRFDALAPAVRQDFNLTSMTAMAVGPSWATMSPEQRQQVTDAFARYTIATYADHFAKNDGTKLEVGAAKQMPYGTVVATKIVQPGGDATDVSYLLRRQGNEWQVADIYLQGTISQIANLRSQFSSVVSSGGAPALVAALNRKTASLVPSAS
ncbi:MAG TPA: ABC transporter substrate-binding protein [Stellaceae bacterium]|nr:ABC transporter substrate-binding protein [Stellaceae bacterium]